MKGFTSMPTHRSEDSSCCWVGIAKCWIKCHDKLDFFFLLPHTNLLCLTFELVFVRSESCMPVFFLPLSTIHGRIDQVNQLLELDYQKRGGARYTALDKWTNQLNTLNQAIVSKLTWWHVDDKANGMLQIHLNYVSALVGFSVMASFRRPQRPWERVWVSFVRRRWSGKPLTLCFLIDWPSLPCATNNCFRWSNPNAQKKTCTQSCAVYCPLLINRFLSTKRIWCLLTGKTLFNHNGVGCWWRWDGQSTEQKMLVRLVLSY